MERTLRASTPASRASQLLRAALLASTCLSATAIPPGLARAQTSLPADTTPQGGSVAAGSASITQSPDNTTIDQASQRAIIDWQSFNVGSAAEVQFNQPSSSAIALNRVISASPSMIAGKIEANGQIVLINQSGVVFAKGSEVNAESLVVATSNIANKDFMAGKMVFSGPPNPGAQIINNGKITVADTGLVGMVAPQVANNGVITARLGEVILAGASAFTLDLYGDRLISLDVTAAVRAVDVGGKLIPALVTNSGLILADGGTVTLTAQDADALVTQLIDAGGTIRADSVGNTAGTISITGVGGDISIAGNLLATGADTGTKGGSIEALTTGTVSLAPTAVVNASGAAGGGVVAIGTDIARATNGAADTAAPRAAAVEIAQGASISAGALQSGNGGKVVLLSQNRTDFNGAISTQGGSLGGNGGLVEISSGGVISLGGTVLDTALNGQDGEILLDPATLVIEATGVTAASSYSSGPGNVTIGEFGISTTTSYITPTKLDALSGNITLEAGSLITVADAVSITATGTNLSLISHGSISVDAGITLDGSLELDANSFITIAAPISVTGSIEMDAPALSIDAGVSATGAAGLVANKMTFGATGTVTAGLIALAPYSDPGIDLYGAGASITGDLDLSTAMLASLVTGTLSIGTVGAHDATTVTQNADSQLTYANILITAPTIALHGSISASSLLSLDSTTTIADTGTLSLGTLIAGGGAGTVTIGGSLLATHATLSGGSLDLTGYISIANELALESTGGITEPRTGTIAAGTLSNGGATATDVTLLGTSNNIGTLDGFTATDFVLIDADPLTVAGPLSADNISLTATSLDLAGNITATAELFLDSTTFDISQTGGSITATSLTGTAATGLALTEPHNDIGTLGAISVTSGDITVYDSGSSTLHLAGDIDNPGNTLTLDAGTITQISGTISTGTLNANAPDIYLSDGTYNSIATLGTVITPGTLLVTGAGGIAGSLTASYATLFSSGDFGLDGYVSIANNFVLTATSGDVTQPATSPPSNGTLFATNATIKAAEIDLEGYDSVSGELDLIMPGGGNGTLYVPGQLFANNADLSAANISITGYLDILDSLILASPGDITEPVSGTIAAGTLSGGGVTATSVSLLGTLNNIMTLAGFSATADFDLNNNTLLTVTGKLVSPDTTLTATSLNLAGDITATDTLVLDGTAGDITQTGGSISTGTLNAQAPDIYLSDGTYNSISTLGTVITPGTLLVTGAGGIAGTLMASYATIFATLGSGGDFALDGYVSIANDFVLTASGEVTQLFGFPPKGTLVATNATITAGEISLGGYDSVSGELELITTGSGGNGNVYVPGQLFARNAYLYGDNIYITGYLDIADALELASPGTIFEPGSATVIAGTLSDGGVSASIVSLLGTSNAIGTLAGFSASSFTLLDSISLDVTDALSASSNITLADSMALTIDAPVNAGTIGNTYTGTIGLAADMMTIGSTGAVTAGLIAIAPFSNDYGIDLGGTAADDLTLTQAVLNSLDVGPHGTLVIGTFSTYSAANVTQVAGNDLTAANISIITPGSIGLGGTVSAASVLLLDSTSPGTITDTGTLYATTLTFDAASFLQGTAGTSGPITAALLTGTATTEVSLSNTLNAIGTLGNISVTGTGGDLILADGSLASTLPLYIIGTVSADTISLSGTSLDIAGLLSTSTTGTTGTLQLASFGTIAETGTGAIDTGTLTTGTGSIAGGVTLNALTNKIGTITNFFAGSNLTLADALTLTIDGTIDLDFPSLDSVLALLAPAITETSDGVILAGELTSDGGTIGEVGTVLGSGNAFLTQTYNTIPVLGTFKALGTIALYDSGASTLDIQGVVDNDIDSTNQTLTIDGKTITETTGTILTGTLNADALDIFLSENPDIYNTIGTLGTVITPGTLLVDGVGGIAGTVIAMDATLASTLTSIPGFTLGNFIDTGTFTVTNNATIFANVITLAGSASITHELDLIATGNIIHDMGTLIAGTLTGTVGTLFDGAFLVGDGYEAVFDANNTTLVTEIGTLSGFIVHDGYFYLYDQEPLVVEGPVVADQINLTADGQLTLDGAYGGGFFISSTIANSLTTAASGLDSSLVVNPYGGQDDIVELGTFYINAGPLAATYNSVEYLGTTNRQATLFMSTGKPNQTGGNISFATATAGLYAPDVELFLSGGTQGALTGNVNVAHLIVQSGLLANLTGSINNFYGQPAAGQGTVQPQPQSKYQFNACPIGSVNCVILAIESLPVENPLQNFDLTQRKRRHLDKSVRLPGIGTRDY